MPSCKGFLSFFNISYLSYGLAGDEDNTDGRNLNNEEIVTRTEA